MRLFVQNQIQQGFVNFDMAVVGDKSQFQKSVHEETGGAVPPVLVTIRQSRPGKRNGSSMATML
jgi:hypothetical protein